MYSFIEEGDDQERSLHETQNIYYKLHQKKRGTTTKNLPALHQSTRTPHMISTTNPELNNYPLGSIPDKTDEATMFNIQNVSSDVPTDYSTSSTSDSPSIYIPVETDEPPMFITENVSSEVLTDSSMSSTSDLPGMYIPDETDEPPMFITENVLPGVPTNSSNPSTADSPRK